MMAATEHQITKQALVRYVAFLRRELETIPSDHPVHQEYEAQLRGIKDGRQVGPQGVA